ncbi:hypothetical protein [Metamycoplasma canadense]|uniref:Uncharacterized protein n=1 Tax=Metamycoplasma canadense TaxID=29554 RepID=A0A077L7G1_9BACT|nr:hypothetical protein [Metamycoplasma canadense]BAP39756.1 hypothetical protein MCAN360_0714 [Metamycoplasma canadense]
MKNKLFPEYLKNISQKETEFFEYKNNHILGKIGPNFNCFNEVTIELLSYAIVNILKSKNLDIKLLIANDGLSKYASFFEKKIANIISYYTQKIYCFKNHTPVSEAFFKYTNLITESFGMIIYFHKFSEDNKFAISFFNKNNDPLSEEIIKEIIKEYKKININDNKNTTNDLNFLNFDKLLKEYTDFLIKKNFTKDANHLLNIGIIYSSLQNTFIKKILGKNDIAYKVFKKNFKKDKPLLINFSFFYFKSLKNIDYIIKFSYDYKKLYLYKRNYSKKTSLCFELVDITDLICNYLSFTNTILNTNRNFSPIKKIYSNNLVKKEYILSIASYFKLDFQINWLFRPNLINDENSIYFDEENNVYLFNSKKIGYDAFSFFTVLIDMLNYYKTQGMKYEDICSQNLSFIDQLKITEFEIHCIKENVINFETKLFIQDNISLIKVNSIENVKEYYKNEFQKYIAKFNFEQSEWMSIKYDFKNEKLIFLVCETKKTNGNLAKKIKKYMKKFTKKYNKPLIKLGD